MAVTGTAGREESPKFGFSLLSQVLVGEVIRQALTKAAVNPGVRPTLPRNSVHALMPHRPKPEAKIARNPGALIVNSPLGHPGFLADAGHARERISPGQDSLDG
jgi:hypothetical protein